MKVRCDGNKEGCKRCSEKHLECTYSISRVGKVVGKRRKRPLPDAEINDSRPHQWSVTVGSSALPSPTSTNGSDHQSKASCMSADWAHLVSYQQSASLDFSSCEEQFLNLDMESSTLPQTTESMPFTLQTGLPTPSMSPPETRYPSSSDNVTGIRADYSIPATQFQRTNSRRISTAFTQKAERTSEDNEDVCIRLLAHLKRISQQEQSCSTLLALVQKTNAALARLLKSRSVHTDYSCHLLLTNIMLHLTSLCERHLQLSQRKADAQLEAEFVHDSYLVDSESDAGYGSRQPDEFLTEMRPVAQRTIVESVKVNASISELLKRKPLNGFQVLGRHESAHVETDVRLRRVLSSL